MPNPLLCDTGKPDDSTGQDRAAINAGFGDRGRVVARCDESFFQKPLDTSNDSSFPLPLAPPTRNIEPNCIA